MSALWDYGPHDLAFALDLLGRDPESLNARVICGDGKDHVVSVELGFSDGRIGNSRVWEPNERESPSPDLSRYGTIPPT